MKFALLCPLFFLLSGICAHAIPDQIPPAILGDSSQIESDCKKNPLKDSTRIALWQVVENAHDSISSALARFAYGEYLDEEGENDEAIVQLKLALTTAQNIANDSLISSIANYLAFVYWASGDFTTSIQTYETGLQSAERSHDSSTMAKISMNLANNYNYLGAYDKAIQNALYALKIKEAAKDMERICYHYVSMSNIFRENDNTAKWEEYLQKAYRMKDVEGCASLGDIAKIYNGLGGIARERKEYDQALAYYDTLMTLSLEVGYHQGINTALTNSAIIYEQRGQLRKALDMAIEAEQYFGNNGYDRIFANNFKAGIYQGLGMPDEALPLVKENIENEEIESYSTEKLKSLNLLYELNFALKNYREAYRWNDAYRELDNKIRDEAVRKIIEEIETQYETEKNQQQINLLVAENKISGQRVRLSWLFIAFLVLLIALTLALLFFRRRQAGFRHSELQQQLLRSQMNPHFIFNVMGSIQSYLYKNEPARAADYLSRFASLSRSVLDFSSQECVSLKEEIEMLQNYIELERAGMDKPFEVEFKIDPDTETEFIVIPPMLLQPFVENAIKHGLRNLPYPGKLSLSFIEKADSIDVEILDNGGGFLSNKNSLHKSKALEIFSQRKKIIEHRYKKALTFEMQDLKTMDSSRHGVSVNVQIPILNND